ncbi:coiled-coil domain-containing protein [Slackia isoflavoniconvertens]|uniref:coiled-coil domain-containing protein n=1 Tax=Slackia isoflavoniconvertens TaxID=572010 RepID=UPI002E7AADA4|nr:NlpC/P60 family protein [Slackia isoflavoniconvertens]
MTTLNARLTRRAFLGGAAAFGAAAMVSPKNAFANPTSADVQAQADEARQKLNSMREQLGAASANYNQAVQEHDEAVSKMDECQTKIDDNNAQIDKLQDKLSKRARNMYRDGQTTFLDVILGSNSFDDFAKNWDTLTSLNEKDSEMVEQTKNLRADNEAQKQEYANQADIAQQKVEEADAAQKQAEELVQQYQNEVDSLDSQVAELLAEEEAAAQKAAEEAAAAAAQAEAASASSNTSSSASNSSASSDSSSDSATSGSASDNGGGSSSGSSSSSSSSSSSGGGSNNYGGSVVAAAQSQLGVPYVWGGTAWGSGLDCSGLTSGCWKRAAGIWIGRTTWDQIASAQWTGSVSEAQAGDVYACGSHVAIATGGGGYIHAPQPGEVVCYSSLSWYNPFYCALRWY